MTDLQQIDNNIPRVLKDRPQWVLWKYVSKGAGTKPTKVPVNAVTFLNASSTDPNTWCSYEQAIEALQSHSALGLGFVVTQDDPFCGLDLDNCVIDGQISPEAKEIISEFASYAEYSPSGLGVRIFIRGKKTQDCGCKTTDVPGMGALEIYDCGRYLTVTGNRLEGAPSEVVDAQELLSSVCSHLWPKKQNERPLHLSDYLDHSDAPEMASRERRCLAYLQQCPDAISGQGGHDATLRAACECYRFGLDDSAAWRVMQWFNSFKTGDEPWSEKELGHKLDSARKKVTSEAGVRIARANSPSVEPARIAPPNILDLIEKHPHMREPLIHGLLRRGETANLIAAAKTGKSWMSLDLAIAVAIGGKFLDHFQCEPGAVLLIDNELHPETLANRLPKVVAARRLELAEVGKNIFVQSLRGSLRDLPGMETYFRGLEPGRFALIICDAFYRFLPGGMDENDNGAMAGLYNLIDRYAAITGSSFVLIHHTSKGDQSMKAVTDVGSGAGAQSRAPDAHIALRRHEEDDCAVFQAEVRSWPQPQPLCLRWTYPVWLPDPSLDPTALRSPGSRRAGRPPAPKTDEWTPQRFVAQFVTDTPRPQAAIYARAESAGLTVRRSRSLLAIAEGDGLIYRWRSGAPNRADFATIPQPQDCEKTGSRSVTNTPHTPLRDAVRAAS